MSHIKEGFSMYEEIDRPTSTNADTTECICSCKGTKQEDDAGAVSTARTNNQLAVLNDIQTGS